MKKFRSFFATVICLLLTMSHVIAQDKEEIPDTSTPRWVSAKGYWVVESNVRAPGKYTVRFYNNDQVQVYQEKLEGVSLRFHKRKTKMLLKQALETSISNWEKQQVSRENEGWVLKLVQKKA